MAGELNIVQTDRGLAADVTVKLPHGVHSRPSAKVSQTARTFDADIRIVAPSGEADAKSMLDLLALAIPCNAPVQIVANGPDAKAAIMAIAAILTEPWPAA